MWRFSRLAPDMRINLETAGMANVALKARSEFAQVVPEPGKTRPFDTKTSSKFCGQLSHFLTMFDEIVWSAPIPVFISCNMGNGMAIRRWCSNCFHVEVLRC